MISLVLLLATILAFSIVAPVSAEDAPELVAQWAVPAGSGISGIAVDASDNVFVTGRGAFRVYTFSPNGDLINQWHAVCPVGMGVDSMGYTYTGDQCQYTVHRFKPDGSGDEEGSWTSHQPFNVKVDHNDFVYATDYHGLHVYKYDTSGNLLITFGTTEHPLCNPHSVAVDESGNVFITDTCRRVVKFNSAGQYILEWNSPGVNGGTFDVTKGIAVDSYGDVYLIEHGRIQKFDNDGNFIVAWGGFSHPNEVALDDTDRLYVTDTGNDLIKIFSAPVQRVTCGGFEPPMANYPVMVKKNRALPLKAKVFDADGYAMTDVYFTAPPVLQVLYDSGVGGDPTDVTDDALSAGHGTDGNQFVFTDEGYWQFNLKTKNYSAPGTYWQAPSFLHS